MSRLCLNRPIYLLFLAVLPALACPAVFAQKAKSTARLVQVFVESGEEAESATGIFLSSLGAKELAVSSIKRLDPSTLVVSIPFELNQATPDTMATAMVRTASGQTIFGHMMPIVSDDAPGALDKIQPCPSSKRSLTSYPGQLAMLETLVFNRARQRNLEQVSVAKLLSDDFLKRMQVYESKFGLSYQSELNPDLPPVELIDRLSRILASLKVIRARIERRNKELKAK